MYSHSQPSDVGHDRSYDGAIRCLNSLQTDASVLEGNRQAGVRSSGKEAMREAVKDIGFEIDTIDSLNILHVAGTKGKGTTCTFLDAILNTCCRQLDSSYKIGLYTSPHVQFVRERIKINSEMISEMLFAESFFELWDLTKAKQLKLGYFRFLTLLSFYIFQKEGVNVAIYETGVGGEEDSTNIVRKPLATGITSLGLDHTRTLGTTIEEIAWHKAGIIKANCPAFAVRQVPSAEAVLKGRATKIGAPLSWVSIEAELIDVDAPEHGKINMSLALAMAEEFFRKKLPPTDNSCRTIAKEILEGMRKIELPGRLHTIEDGNIFWLLDGAHTTDSLNAVGEWCAKITGQSSLVLVFHSDPKKRDSEKCLQALFKPLAESGKTPQYVLFCTPEQKKSEQLPIDLINKNKLESTSLETQRSIWERLDSQARVYSFPTLDGAYIFVKQLSSNKIHALVTGSFHLVGGMLHLVESRRSPKKD